MGYGKLAAVSEPPCHGARYRVRPVLRLLPLPISIALCLPALADDKPQSWALCPIEDPVPAFDGVPQPQAGSNNEAARAARAGEDTSIEGDALTGTESDAHYSGNVTLRRGDQFLGADNLKFDQETNTYSAEGHVRYQDAGIRIVAESARGDQEADRHQIDNLQYQLIDRRGNGGADRIDMSGAEGKLYHSTYSTCDPDDRIWELRAHRIDVDTESGWGVARGATIRMGHVPVLYVPWFKFPVDDRRHTGLLYPALSRSGRNGLDYRQPIYLNLAPNYDATLYPRYMSERGFALGGEFRYLYRGGKGTLVGNYMHRDDLLETRSREPGYQPELNPDIDDSRGMFGYDGYHNINGNWQARANLVWFSDPRYTEDFSNSLAGLSAASTTSTLGVYGVGDGWTAGAMADTWQLMDFTSSPLTLPYNRLPRVYFNWERPLTRWFSAGVQSEAVRFQHNERGDGTRLDLKPYVSLPIQGASWYVTPTVAWRHTAYDLEPELASQLAISRAARVLGVPAASITPAQMAPYYDEKPSRSLPIGSLDAGLFFDRETEIKGTHFLQTLEPRLFYLNVPYRNQDALPVFDTRAFTFSWGQMFRDNRYTGPDRQADANQLTLALTTRWLRQTDGIERFSASIGQIRYFEDSRVVLSNEQRVQEGKSAWIADANYMPNDRWTFGASYQWDPKTRKEDLASFRSRYLIGDDGVINLNYRSRVNQLEQVDFSFLYPISPSWSVVGRYYYSLYDDPARNIEPGLLEAIAGVQWDSCCLAVRAVVRRYVRNREGEMNNSFQVEFILKGLGSAGQNTERTLRRGILGYYRDDLYLVPPSNTTPDPDDDPNVPDVIL